MDETRYLGIAPRLLDAAMKPPSSEDARLRAVSMLALPDQVAVAQLTALAAAAARSLDAGIGLVSLIAGTDVVHLGQYGTNERRTRRASAFCAHVIDAPDGFFVEDALYDVRFADNPRVLGMPFVRFYAGLPLRHADHVVGAFSVQDVAPRSLSRSEIDLLRTFARRAETLFGP